MEDDSITLNVGGTVFRTSRSTLESEDSSFFSGLLSGLFAEPEDGVYFIDRDPTGFRCVLDYLRTGELYVPTTIPIDLVLREASYFCVDLPTAIVDECRSRRAAEGHADPKPPAAVCPTLHSDGYYIAINTAATDDSGGSGLTTGTNVVSLAVEFPFIQFCRSGNCVVVAKRSRDTDNIFTAGNTPAHVVLSPTFKYTFEALNGLVYVNEIEERGERDHQFVSFYGAVYSTHILVPESPLSAARLAFYKSQPPLPNVAYQLATMKDRKQRESTVKMIVFKDDDDNEGVVSSATWTNYLPTVHGMTVSTAPCEVIWRRATHVPGVSECVYEDIVEGEAAPADPADMAAAVDDGVGVGGGVDGGGGGGGNNNNNNNVDAPADNAEQEGDGGGSESGSEEGGEGDAGAAANAPQPADLPTAGGQGEYVSGVDGGDRVCFVRVLDERFHPSRMISMGELLIEHQLGSTFVFVAMHSV